MKLQKGQIIDLDIKALAFGGAGIGKYEGLNVFVEGTLPGDRDVPSQLRFWHRFDLTSGVLALIWARMMNIFCDTKKPKKTIR